MDVWTVSYVGGKKPVITLVDAYSNAPSIPDENNDNNDLTLISANQMNGMTTVTFERPITTGDTAMDVDLIEEKQRFTYAYHPTDPDYYTIHSLGPEIYKWYFSANLFDPYGKNFLNCIISMHE